MALGAAHLLPQADPFDYGALGEFCTSEALPRLRAVLDAMGDGLAVVDRNGRVLLTNPAAERILRRPVVAVDPGRWSEHYGFYLPDGATRYPGRALPLVRAIRGEDCDAAEVLVRHAGAPEGAWISVTARPLRDERGAVQGGVVVFRDVTERKRAEEERLELLARERAARAEAETRLVQRRTVEERLRLLVDASAHLLGTLNMERLLPAVLDLARTMVVADGYAVWRRDAEAPAWRVVACEGIALAFRNDVLTAAEYQAMPDQPIIFENVAEAPLVANRRKAYHRAGVRSILAVPLHIHGLNSGCLTFYSQRQRRFDEGELQAAAALANLAGAAITTAELYEQQSRMRSEAEVAERRSRFLGEATHLLGSSLDYETTLAQVARMAVPHVADWCAVYTIEEDGAIRLLAVAHADPAKVEWARELASRYPPDPGAPYGVANALRTGQPEFLREIPDEVLVAAARDAEHLAVIRKLGLTSYMCVPVIARSRTLGAILFASAESGRRYGPEDLAVAQHLARRAGLAIDNARLYSEAHRDRAVAEQSLAASQRSEARFHRLMESGILAIVLGEAGTITEANDVFLQMTGCTREDLAAGRITLPGISPPEYERLDANALQELLTRGASTPYEKEFLCADGSRVPVYVGSALLEGPPRLSWVAFVLDLSERKQLEQRLRDSQKLESIGLLAGGIAHDFNNLLTGIMGNASLAIDDLPAESPLHGPLEQVLRASERAAHLTRQLLAYSGRGRFVVQPLDISELVREISGLVRMSVSRKVDLHLDLAPDLPAVEADPAQMQQLIMNLVLNAAEAIGDDVGTVLVRTGYQEVDERYRNSALMRDHLALGWYVAIDVQDTGCGMDEETKSRIFDPFFTTKFTGRGLGLAAALGIVRGHRGDIRVSSAPGRGSTFSVLLPPAGAPPAPHAGEPPHTERVGTGTVLLVDDEEVIRHTARAALERYGYTVVTASDGREAVDVFRSLGGRVSAVLLDLTMPVLSGVEAYAEIRRIRPGVKVIVSSGYSEQEAERRFTGTGIAGFIQKPYTAGQLAHKLKAVLDGPPSG